MYIEKVNKKN